jgi:serine protease DegQ
VKLGLMRDGKPLDVEVTLDKSTSSSASAELIAPALQGATLSDGQLKDGTKGISIDTVDKAALPRRPDCIRMMSSLALTATRAVHCRTAQGAGKQTAVIALVMRGNESIYILLR